MILTEHATKQDWLEARKNGLGGSDAAAILGLSPWRTPLDVYMERVGMVSGPDENERMKWGTLLEEPIADEYRRRTGCKFKRCENAIATHAKYDWMLASPDRLIHGQKKGLEVKTAGGRAAYDKDEHGDPLWGEEGTDQVPVYYLLQCQHYLAVTGFEAWDLAVLIGGQDYRVYTIKPDIELHEKMISGMMKFWYENVKIKNPPAPSNNDDHARFLAAKFKKNNGTFLQASRDHDALNHLILSLKNVRYEESVIAKNKDKIENEIKAIIGEYDGIEFGEKSEKITWKKSKDSIAIDWESYAKSLGCVQPVPEEFVTKREGVRKFLTPASWRSEYKQTEMESEK